MIPVILRPGIGDNRPTATLYYGQDVRETLRLLPEASVHAVCTSPPYWGLRNYGADGQIGLEPTPEEFVAALVEVFREVKRVLRPDGTLWLNLGDSYTSGGRTGHGTRVGFKQQTNCGMNGTRDPVKPPQPPNIKSKDLIGIPWRVAFALQADGWYLRQDIVWAKPNPMPESVTDRCTKAHEYIFLLSKSERYFFDSEAMKEPCSEDMQRRAAKGHTRGQGKIDTSRNDAATVRPTVIVADTRNRRSVWTVTTQPYSGAHFATWPPDLVLPMILAGTSTRGVCAACGAPWKRVMEPGDTVLEPKPHVLVGGDPMRKDGGIRVKDPSGRGGNALLTKHMRFTGWEPTCGCVDPGSPVPATVLDPFSGSATTGMVALREGRNYIGVDLNPDYLELATARIEGRQAPQEAETVIDFDVFSLLGDSA